MSDILLLIKNRIVLDRENEEPKIITIEKRYKQPNEKNNRVTKRSNISDEKKYRKTKKSKSNKTQHDKKNKIKIPICHIISLMTIPQRIAADLLGVSISTLKRRYYELEIGRWPVNSGNSIDEENVHEYRKNQIVRQLNPSLYDIINEKDYDANYIDPVTTKVLNCAFKQYTSK